MLPVFAGMIHGLQSKARPNDNESLVIGMVAFQSGEGVSTVAANMAFSFSFDLEQEILLVSANSGDSTLSRMLDVRSKVGLNSVIERKAPLLDALSKSPKCELSLLNHGVPLRKSFSPYLVSRFGSVIEELRQKYRVIVVDLPALNKPSHAPAIAAQLDGVVLVVDSSRTRKEQCVEAKRLLERNGANVVGVILNRQSR